MISERVKRTATVYISHTPLAVPLNSQYTLGSIESPKIARLQPRGLGMPHQNEKSSALLKSSTLLVGSQYYDAHACLHGNS